MCKVKPIKYLKNNFLVRAKDIIIKPLADFNLEIRF